MLESGLKSKIDQLWDLFWSGGIANHLTAIEQISYLLFMKRLDDKDIKQKKEAKFAGKKYQSIFKSNGDLRWSHWKHFEAEEMLNYVQDKVFPFIKKLNSESGNGFSTQMKDAVFIIPKPSLLVQAVEIIESLKIHEQNQDTQGDIYEYLLSELKSSGKNGQFRTPRHIIKMMCELVGLKIGQTVCDPACGTGGFLIGAYQHVLKQYTSPELVTVDKEGMEHGLIGDKITSQKIWRYLKNKTFYGFDFDSTMLRISAMNMVLHGIENPNIRYLDSISKNNKEENLYDVILANPPFKGNIDKNDIHEALSRTVKTTRTELLFVAQMMRLLKVGGQCAVIVPNGVLFRSDKAHTAIRQKIIEEAQLEAVISMPSGVFKPYAGVSTAALLFTKGGETDKVWFYDMIADGFSLDDKRDKIEENDIPDIIEKWNRRRKLKEPAKEDKWFFVNKKKIVESGDYSLNGRIYEEITSYGQTKWPMIELGKICEIVRGGSPRPIKNYITKNGNGINWIKIGDVAENEKYVTKTKQKIKKEGATKTRLVKSGDFILSNSMSFGRPYILKIDRAIHDGWLLIRINNNQKMFPDFLYQILRSNIVQEQYQKLAIGGVVKNLKSDSVRNVQIPFPPLEVQREIIEEVGGYQKIVDGAKQVVENWKPTLKIDPTWPLDKLGEICDVRDGTHESPKYVSAGIPFITSKNLKDNNISFENVRFISQKDHNNFSKRSRIDDGDVLFGMIGTIGHPVIVKKDREFSIKNVALFKFKNNKVLLNYYLQVLLDSKFTKDTLLTKARGGSQKFVSLANLRDFQIPLPPMKVQKEIVTEIEKEKALVESCKELMKINEEKIQQKINKIWR